MATFVEAIVSPTPHFSISTNRFGFILRDIARVEANFKCSVTLISVKVVDTLT